MNKQPPFVKAPLYTRIEALKAEARDQIRPITHVTLDQAKSLYEGVKAWSQSLTPDQLNKRYSTLEVIRLAKLTGRYRELPALQQVAHALRLNGFDHKRSWTNDSRNQRYWKFKGEAYE